MYANVRQWRVKKAIYDLEVCKKLDYSVILTVNLRVLKLKKKCSPMNYLENDFQLYFKVFMQKKITNYLKVILMRHLKQSHLLGKTLK